MPSAGTYVFTTYFTYFRRLLTQFIPAVRHKRAPVHKDCNAKWEDDPVTNDNSHSMLHTILVFPRKDLLTKVYIFTPRKPLLSLFNSFTKLHFGLIVTVACFTNIDVRLAVGLLRSFIPVSFSSNVRVVRPTSLCSYFSNHILVRVNSLHYVKVLRSPYFVRPVD